MKIKILISLLLLTSILSVIIRPCQAQELKKEKLHWWGDIDGFLNKQHEASLELVNKALSKFPPTIDEPLERRMAMLMLDEVLHEEHAGERRAVQDFLKRRINNSIKEIASVELREGALIWKLYNHGFVVKTKSVTIGFDLVRGNSRVSEGFTVEDETYRGLVDECDILFISHRHGDHADLWVAQTFIEQGKPVVAPPEVWKDEPIYNKIKHLPREAFLNQDLLLHDGMQISIINFPGHQGSDIENNVVLVTTPEGMIFAHTGDQSGPAEEWGWIDNIGAKYNVDVLFPNCWTPDILRMINGMTPNLVITGHENEMGHTIDHRESNWLSYTRLKGASKPYIMMSWGEAYHYYQE